MKSVWSSVICVSGLFLLTGCAATAPGGHFGHSIPRYLLPPVESRSGQMKVYELPKLRDEQRVPSVREPERGSGISLPLSPDDHEQPVIPLQEEKSVEPPRKKTVPMPIFRRGSQGASIALIWELEGQALKQNSCVRSVLS